MVENVAAMRRKFRNAPRIIHQRLERGLERIAADVVADMQMLNPLPGEIVIDWTWGDAPKGSIRVAQFGKSRQDAMMVTIYAKGFDNSDGDYVAPWWYEFGTAPRFQKTTGRYTGQIIAQPFFYPGWRMNRRSVRNRLNGILRRAVKKANSTA